MELATQVITDQVRPIDSETVSLMEAHRRVLAESIVAGQAVPGFARSAMDGYAVRGEETFGSDPYVPSRFRIVGEARPGRAYEGTIRRGESVRIMTGAPLPEGVDAVVPVEGTRMTEEGVWVEVVEPTPPGRHVGQAGEDVTVGSRVLEAGRILRPQDLGILSALGIARVPVVRRPVVAVLATGDELLPPGSVPNADRIPDMNSPMLAALIERDGGLPILVGPLADDREGLRRAMIEAVASADAVLVSGGSSTGIEDHAPGLVAELGSLPVHGIALRPASPTGIGFISSRPVLLLPGNPVSCLCAYDFFAGRVVRRLAGRSEDWPYRPTDLPLHAKLTSALGRVDYVRVAITAGRVEPLATSGASILSSTTRADGFVVVPADLEGYPAGETVRVWLYDLPS